MPKFRVWVKETITVHYPVVEIEAEDEDEAQEIGEEMRAQGELGNPHDHESVDEVDVDVKEITS